jgi:hypothetical protein
MTLTELLAELDVRRVRVEAIGGRLRVDAPVNALTAGMRDALAEHRAVLLARLESETGAGASLAPPPEAEPGASGEGDRTGTVAETDALLILPRGTIRIPLDELVYGDFLARHGLRIVDGAAYPDGRTYRPTLYLAEDHW